MKVSVLGFCLFVLAACNTAGPYFRGAPATRIEVNGSVFDVRLKDDLAEAMRVNSEYAPRFGPIRQRAAFAMAAVSGCTVTDVLGDQALATGWLNCKDQHMPVSDTGNCIPIGTKSRNGRVPDRVGARCKPP